MAATNKSNDDNTPAIIIGNMLFEEEDSELICGY